MSPKQLEKIKLELARLRRSPQGIKSSTLVGIAGRLGRVRSHRGKEPTYLRTEHPNLAPPLSIPSHGKDLKTGTARSIIDQLLSDVDEWELYLLENSRDAESDNDEGN
jgi:hypothetical protein